MKILWDERKRLANLDKHRLDFASLNEDFFAVAVIRKAKLNRFMAVGRLSHQILAVIFSPLGSEGLSIVSMRPAHHDERVLLNAKEN